MLRDLLGAVIDNAVQATSQNEGAVRVSLSRERVDGKEPPGFEQSIRVEDQGCGIEPTRIPYLQFPILAAFRNSGVEAGGWQGRGFGLPMAFTFARQMGGRISVESRPGEGTLIALTLPEAGETEERSITSA
jgi:signal transduction histidine kinase